MKVEFELTGSEAGIVFLIIPENDFEKSLVLRLLNNGINHMTVNGQKCPILDFKSRVVADSNE